MGSCDICSRLDSGEVFVGRNCTDVLLCPQGSLSGATRSLFCRSIGDIHFDHLVRELSAAFLRCQVRVFPFVIRK